MAIADVVDETLAALPVDSVAGQDIAFLLHVDGRARAVAEQAVTRRVT
jgi:hypothetical protein